MNPTLTFTLTLAKYFSYHIGWLAIFIVALSLIAVSLSLFLVRKKIFSFFGEIDGRTYIALFAILLLAFYIRVSAITPSHIMFDDEFEYRWVGNSLVSGEGVPAGYTRSLGWHFILSVSFLAFGVSAESAIYTNMFFAILTIALIFFLAYSFTKRSIPSLVSALAFALCAPHLRWSAASETNIVSLFFICATMLAIMIYSKTQDEKLKILIASLTAFTIMIRPENIVLLPLAIVSLLLIPKKLNKSQLIIGSVAILILLIPNFANVLSCELGADFVDVGSNGTIEGENFSLSNLIDNTTNLGRYAFDPIFISPFVSILCAIGLIALTIQMLSKRQMLSNKMRPDRNEPMSNAKNILTITSVWFLSFFIVYMISYFQTLGGNISVLSKDRFFMMLFAPALIWFAYGVSWIAEKSKKWLPFNKKGYYTYALIILFVVTTSLPPIRSIQSNPDPLVLLTHIADLAKKDIPHDCTIVANRPLHIQASAPHNIHLPGGLAERIKQGEFKGKCLIFFEGIECDVENDIGNEQNRQNCREMLELATEKPYATYSYGIATYRFHLIRTDFE